jgi:tetratricopeptide (TPR) repeat protein
MNKDNFLFAVIGLLLGTIIGFTVANKLNRDPEIQPNNPTNTAALPPSNPSLPPDHPSIGTSGKPTIQDDPLPQVAEAIEKAKKNPNDFEAQMTAADLYYQIQKFEDAATFYQTANKLRPNEIEPLIKLGNSYFDAEKYEEAEKWYEAALKKTPNDINVRTDYGLTFFLRNPRNIDRAIKEYKISLDIDPKHELTLQNLAIAFNEKKDSENLQKVLDVLKSVNSNNPAIKELYGNIPNSQTN